MFDYSPLWNTLEKKGISQYQLIKEHGFSTGTLDALRKNNNSALEKECLALSEEYKTLIRLDKQITYAETPSFLFGSLFSEKVHKAPEVLEKEERGQKPEQDGARREAPVRDMDLER